MYLAGDVKMQLTYRYSAPRNSPQGRRLSLSVMDLGLSKEVFNKKGTLALSVRDVFNSRIWRSIIDQPDLYQEGEFQWASRMVILSLNYRLNQKNRRGGGRGEGREGGGYDGGDDSF